MQTSDDQRYLKVAEISKMRSWLPHPAVVISLWMYLVFAIQSLHAAGLLLLGSLLMFAAVNQSLARLYSLLRRTRWIMLSLLLVYGYVTPGETLWTQAGMYSPTRQGMLDGLIQLSRLVLILTSLSVVLATLSRHRLISGLYTLFYPLHYLGVSRERIAVRLALTLEYAESALIDTSIDWRNKLNDVLLPTKNKLPDVELQVMPLTRYDGMLLISGFFLLLVLL